MPHSDILGSKPVCGSPKLFAAYHVLHRLLAPRHSPYALSSLTIRNSRLTPIAGSRLAGSRVRTCRTANRELRIAACDSPLHTACVLTPPALAGAVDCGRKKLPFAGYSVVKESVKLSALQLLEVRLRLSARARQPLSKLMGRRRSQQAPFLLRPASLARTCDCYISDTEVQAEVQSFLLLADPVVCVCEVRLRPIGLRRDSLRLRRQTSAGSPAEPKPASASAPAGEGWWRIPGSNR